MDARRLVALPDDIDDETAACLMVKGLTAQFLSRRTFRLRAGQTILFHAAAGGVGLIASQRADLLEMSADLFAQVRAGNIRVRIGQRYALEEAARAHVDLEARNTTGQSLLIPAP